MCTHAHNGKNNVSCLYFTVKLGSDFFFLLLSLFSFSCKCPCQHHIPSFLCFSTLFSLSFFVSQAEERRRGGHTESNGFGNHSNHGNLPDLVQQSNSPSATPTTALQELSDMAEVRHTHSHSLI